MSCQGEPVQIEFSSADASAAAAVSLFNADGAARTLAAHERLLIDSGTVTVVTTTATLITDGDGDGAVDAGERIGVFAAGTNPFEFGEEGFACPIGKTPKVKGAAAGQIDLVATGRIVKGKTEGVRPSYREPLMP